MKIICISLFLFIFLISSFTFSSLAQHNKIDSLLSLIQNDKSDTNKINYLNTLCLEYLNIGNYDTALQYGNAVLQLSRQTSKVSNNFVAFFRKGEATAYNNIGIVYRNQGNYEKALENHFASLKIREEIGDKKGIATSYNNIGGIYWNQGNYEKALENHFASLKIYGEIGDKKGIAASYNNIGLIYWNQDNYEKALVNYFASLKIYEEIGNKKGIAACYSNIGSIYHNQGNYEKALENDFASLKIREEIRDKNGIAVSYINIGGVYDNQGNYDKALVNYLASLKIYEEIGDKKGIATSYNNIGNLYLKQNKIAEAKKQSLASLIIAKEIGSKENIKEAYQALSLCDSVAGNWKGTYHYHQLYSTIKDSIFNEESNKQITEMSTKYETEKKEQQIKLLEKDKVIQNKDLEKQKTIRNAVAGGLILMLLFSFVLINRFLLIRKQKKLIEIQKSEVEKQKNVIEEKNKDITDSINYAKKIQEAILITKEEIQQALPNSFILFKPKDIVSGDFYWFSSVEKNGISSYIIAACDCTGHGVPGAFMTMIGNALLNEIVNKEKILVPSEILNELRKDIIIALKQKGQEGGSRDGMDIALINLQLTNDNRKLAFSGAHRPLYLIRNGELKEYAADRQPIGLHIGEEKTFTNHAIELQKGDTIYIFTDGFTDQFGGEHKKKFTSKKFRELLLSIQNKNMQEQEMILKTTIENWIGKLEQLDDVLVMGVRI